MAKILQSRTTCTDLGQANINIKILKLWLLTFNNSSTLLSLHAVPFGCDNSVVHRVGANFNTLITHTSHSYQTNLKNTNST